MTSRKSNAADPTHRLLALLVEDDAIETAPIAEVRAELAALGRDPAPAIALARRLAAAQASPAWRLLDEVAHAEADEQDIARLEQADLATIRAQLPAKHAAAITARLRGGPDKSGKVVDLRRRRRRAYGWGGLAAAASIMLVIAASWRLLEVDPMLIVGGNVSSEIPAASRAERPVGDADTAQPAALAPPAAPSEVELLQQAGVSRQRADAQSDLKVGARLLEARLSPDAALTALLIVDPRLAPPAMRNRAYPERDLVLRLPQARRIAAGHAVVALVRLQDATATHDLVVLARPAEEAEKSEAQIPASLRALLGEGRTFAVVPLPAL
jgi:hypothetical protein